MDSQPAATLTATSDAPRGPERVRVVVVAGADRGRFVDLERGTALVGTHPDCHLVLSDGKVSRRHLSIELLAHGVRVTDLGSKNRTRFLGAELEMLELPMGGTLDLGPSTSLTIVPQPAADVVSDALELGPMVGASLCMRRLFASMERVGPTDTACLLVGETGTGKELAARMLHALSPRAAGPFVVVECGALTASLANATLFGHARGAFTGAVGDAPGLLGAADGGTLFLDEVAALPLDLQPLLLRALETRTYQRVGEAHPRRSDFRLLTATREALPAVIEQGRFRADLYYRLSAVTLELPPLRARADDLTLLARRFAEQAGVPLGQVQAMLGSRAGWQWPGNVRELKNAVEAARVLGDVALTAQSPAAPDALDFHSAKEQVVSAFERNYLQLLLARHEGNLAAVAREAGIGRSHLYRLLEAHGLDAGAYR